MKKLFLSPLFAGLFVVFCMVLYYALSYAFRLKYGAFDIEKIGVTEVLTYLFYAIAGGVLLYLHKDFLHTPKQNTYFALCFLWLVALLREMGIQHWLTQHDSTAIKIRFFTNPNNPLHEKIITATLVLLVVGVIAYLLIKYFKKMIVGFFKFQTIAWTIATFGGLGIVTQLADRFPANYVKSTGEHLTEPVRFALKIFEEGGESLLPLIFAIGLWQFHFILRKKASQIDDGSKDIVQGSV